MLKLTRKTDYGLIALRHLALAGGSASAKEIAERYGVPQPLLAKVLQTLARGGFLKAAHGTNGGYSLARDPRTINALEVIRALDGPVLLTSCSDETDDCCQAGRCSVREPLRRIEQGMRQLLEGVSISEMGSTLTVIEP